MTAKLRIYPSHPEDDSPRQTPTIPIKLEELLPILAQAYRHHYAWLQDFLDDEIAVTPDLYDVIRSFQCYRPSA